jgi:hypothetical protein
MNRLIAAAIAGTLAGVVLKVKNLEIGPCGPAWEDWSNEMSRLMREYNLNHPDAPLTYEQACEYFSNVNPRPKPMKLFQKN